MDGRYGQFLISHSSQVKMKWGSPLDVNLSYLLNNTTRTTRASVSLNQKYVGTVLAEMDSSQEG
jgi:hypothetical protein